LYSPFYVETKLGKKKDKCMNKYILEQTYQKRKEETPVSMQAR